MKRGSLLRHLRKHGCHLKREGGSHSLWTNPVPASWKSYHVIQKFLIDSPSKSAVGRQFPKSGRRPSDGLRGLPDRVCEMVTTDDACWHVFVRAYFEELKTRRWAKNARTAWIVGFVDRKKRARRGLRFSEERLMNVGWRNDDPPGIQHLEWVGWRQLRVEPSPLFPGETEVAFGAAVAPCSAQGSFR